MLPKKELHRSLPVDNGALGLLWNTSAGSRSRFSLPLVWLLCGRKDILLSLSPRQEQDATTLRTVERLKKHTYVCIYIYIHTHVIYIYTYKCIHACSYITYVDVYRERHVYVSVSAYLSTYIYYIHIFIHVYVYLCIHMHQPMHKPVQKPVHKPMRKPMHMHTHSSWSDPVPPNLSRLRSQPVQVSFRPQAFTALSILEPTQDLRAFS